MTIDRLLVTGAAGSLGRVLRERLAGRYPVLRLTDVARLDRARRGEEVVRADLANAEAAARLCEGVDAIVHLGARSTEADWPSILSANISGSINLFEGARRAGVKRIVFASSNHAIGLHPVARRIDHHAEPLPDGRYGLSKAFGEDLARLYAYKHGIRAMAIRIGSCFETPRDARMLSTWLSHADFVRLIEVGLHADYVFEIVYGVSANTRSWWDNANAERLGYRPLDNAEMFAAELDDVRPADPIARSRQGGGFASAEFDGHPDWLPDG